MRFVLLILLVACSAETRQEDPSIDPDVTARCGSDKRLVRDVCTALGGDDSCSEVDDVCVALCDGKTSCDTISDTLRAQQPWPVAPDGYCVVCLD